MSETIASLIIEALVENDDFQLAVDKAVDMANSTDALPLSDQIDQALEKALDERLKEAILDELKDGDSLVMAVQEEIQEQLAEAMTEHDTILNLIARVETLEKDFEALCVEEPASVVKDETPTELKPVAHGILQVCEDKNFKMFLSRQNSDWEVQHLFAVTYHLPGGSVTRYVIAESLAGAVGQGSCGLAANGIADLDRETAEKNATGIQLPLMLRGWSSYQF